MRVKKPLTKTERISQQNRLAYDKRIKTGITEQDLVVIKLICQEYTSQEIGVMLGKTRRTIDNNRLFIMKILKCKNNVGIVVWAIKKGVVHV